MILYRDSREQLPLRFKHKQISKVIKKKLDFGDYACQFEDGHMVPIYFERKGLGDLYGTLGKGYSRFKKEIIRAQKAKSQLIIIVEATLTSVLKGIPHSERNPQSLVAQIFTLFVKHGVLTVFCSSRKEMAEYITQFYIACGKQYVAKRSRK